ncbi:MAG TPA: cysteine desulfurase, partial [Bacillota bacterium]|nr:cysteine desulfurase [Bacillota bacterium]
ITQSSPSGGFAGFPANLVTVTKPDSSAKLDCSREPSYYFLTQRVVGQKTANRKPKPGPDSGVHNLRQDFPIFNQKINGKPLIWLDNAATTQKPQSVIDTLTNFYQESNSNVHRGVHTLAARATASYEDVRKKVQRFINAAFPEEIIFLRGTTEAVNLVAQSYGRSQIGKGDEIIITTMEHHSNIVPWQLLQQTTGAELRVVPINDRGEIILGEYERLLSRRTRLVALTHVSNVLGTVNPVRTMVEMAHYFGARVLLDGAQAVPHFGVDIQSVNADFYAFSGHKMYGPTGIGVLYGKKELLEAMPPWQGGGSMIEEVTFTKTTYNSLPYKFEAGTGNIADVIGLGAAVDYLQKTGLLQIGEHERELTAYVNTLLSEIPGLRLIGTSPLKTGVVSFLLDGISQEDLAQRLDREGIAVRVGHHCAQPVMQRYGITGTIRVSLGMYNTREEIEVLVQTIDKIVRKKE